MRSEATKPASVRVHIEVFAVLLPLAVLFKLSIPVAKASELRSDVGKHRYGPQTPLRHLCLACWYAQHSQKQPRAQLYKSSSCLFCW